MVTHHQLGRLPGYEIVQKGLSDLAEGIISTESYLVKIGSHNLVDAGLLKEFCEESDIEIALYQHLSETHQDPHYQYKSLTDRLTKFEQALLALSA